MNLVFFTTVFVLIGSAIALAEAVQICPPPNYCWRNSDADEGSSAERPSLPPRQQQVSPEDQQIPQLRQQLESISARLHKLQEEDAAARAAKERRDQEIIDEAVEKAMSNRSFGVVAPRTDPNGQRDGSGHNIVIPGQKQESSDHERTQTVVGDRPAHTSPYGRCLQPYMDAGRTGEGVSACSHLSAEGDN